MSALSAYLDAALWTATDDDQRPLDENYTTSDFSDQAMELASRDVDEFVARVRLVENAWAVLEDLPLSHSIVGLASEWDVNKNSASGRLYAVLSDALQEIGVKASAISVPLVEGLSYIAKAGEVPVGAEWDYNADDLGHDFWMSRNGHGVGFFDRSEKYGPFADVFQELARSFGEVSVEEDADGADPDGNDPVLVFM